MVADWWSAGWGRGRSEGEKRSEGERRPPAPALEKDVPWVIMGLVYMMDLTCELELLGPRQRAEVFKRAARALVGLGGDR